MVYGYKEEEYKDGGTTLPDYQNYRNLLFQQWEELNNAVVEFRTCNKTKYKTYQKEVIRTYLRFFSQINDKNKLGLLNDNERSFLKKYYDNETKINIYVSKILLDITRKLMTEYGVFDLEGSNSDEIW